MKYSKIPFILFAVSLPILWAGSQGRAVLRSITIHDNFETGDLGNWQFPFSEDWKILGSPSERYLHMLRNREPGVPRRPLQFALIKGAAVGSFDFQTRVRREGKSMIVVFNYVDTLHFYYTHLSADRGEAQPVHNGIFIVNGAPRVRIAGTSAEPALPDQAWHHVRVVRDAHTGEIAVFMDHAPKPLFSITDTTFTCGQIGIGSFDETGDFADVNLTSTDAGCQPGSVIRPAAVKQKLVWHFVRQIRPPEALPNFKSKVLSNNPGCCDNFPFLRLNLFVPVLELNLCAQSNTCAGGSFGRCSAPR